MCLLSPVVSGTLRMGLRWYPLSLGGVAFRLEWRQALSVLPFSGKTALDAPPPLPTHTQWPIACHSWPPPLDSDLYPDLFLSSVRKNGPWA